MGDMQSCLACDSKRSDEAAAQSKRTEISIVPGGAHRTSPRSTASTAISTASDGLAKVGIGAYFQRDPNDSNVLLVKSVLKGSPSQLTGKILVGDRITSVDGKSCYGFSLAELAERLLGHPGSEVKC
eukprot:CAMPEP_0172040396 /NCGR_PEP_ID=MMETSP1041-20130122/24475_1 /TAXON_ID=464988 /ORGANISM="Hemiselmis andersenii, Strain CCMP439" /LENGTH=126 /DNA_ID=CAMNT_0012698289 /DNA_START=232 /DNA_END=609 /DNA_ORIENTATION=-